MLYKLLAATLVTSLIAMSSASAADDAYDVVIVNGRVMDPESGLDAVRNVGLRGGKVAAISTAAMQGRRTIDAKGLVVAPGFIDLHEHGISAYPEYVIAASAQPAGMAGYSTSAVTVPQTAPKAVR